MLPSPMRWPQRAAGRKYAARLIDSAPAPTTQSVSPSMMCWAADTIACRPLPHRRLTVRHGVPIGSPPSMPATREMYMSRASP
jgi:hypothetical protein